MSSTMYRYMPWNVLIRNNRCITTVKTICPYTISHMQCPQCHPHKPVKTRPYVTMHPDLFHGHSTEYLPEHYHSPMCAMQARAIKHSPTVTANVAIIAYWNISRTYPSAWQRHQSSLPSFDILINTHLQLSHPLIATPPIPK